MNPYCTCIEAASPTMQIWGRGSKKPIAFTSPFQGLLLQLLQEEEL